MPHQNSTSVTHTCNFIYLFVFEYGMLLKRMIKYGSLVVAKQRLLLHHLIPRVVIAVENTFIDSVL
jgi:hypothetical protein